MIVLELNFLKSKQIEDLDTTQHRQTTNNNSQHRPATSMHPAAAAEGGHLPAKARGAVFDLQHPSPVYSCP